MNNLSQTFGELVEQRLKALKTNPFAAEQAFRLPPDSIRNILRSEKKNGPSLLRAEEICKALGLEIYIGPKRPVVGLAEGDSATDLGKQEALRGGYLPIPWHTECRRNGSAPIAFARLWLDENKMVPDTLSAVVPDMIDLSHTAAKDAVALVDSSASRKDNHGLWCIKEGGQISIALVTFNSAATIIHARDSFSHPRVLAPQDLGAVSVLGRVVWLGQTIPFNGAIR